MKIAISGSTGLVGSELMRRASDGGHRAIPMVRDRNDEGIFWSVAEEEIDAEALAGVDAVIHLAGVNIGSKRWTEERKRKIRDSRVIGTGLIAGAIASLSEPPEIFVCASAVGIYGSRGDEWIDEGTEPGEGFLADMCRQWEAACEPARAHCRVVNTRFGVVLSRQGGALRRMLTPFKMGVGGPVSSGEQFMSWITRTDVARALLFAVENDDLQGPVNVTSPNPVRNSEYTQVLGDILNRPTVIPVPAPALKLLYGGEMVEQVLLVSQRVRPKKLLQAGFEFEYPTIEKGLAEALGVD